MDFKYTINTGLDPTSYVRDLNYHIYCIETRINSLQEQMNMSWFLTVDYNTKVVFYINTVIEMKERHIKLIQDKVDAHNHDFCVISMFNRSLLIDSLCINVAWIRSIVNYINIENDHYFENGELFIHLDHTFYTSEYVNITEFIRLELHRMYKESISIVKDEDTIEKWELVKVHKDLYKLDDRINDKRYVMDKVLSGEYMKLPFNINTEQKLVLFNESVKIDTDLFVMEYSDTLYEVYCKPKTIKEYVNVITILGKVASSFYIIQ